MAQRSHAADVADTADKDDHDPDDPDDYDPSKGCIQAQHFCKLYPGQPGQDLCSRLKRSYDKYTPETPN